MRRLGFALFGALLAMAMVGTAAGADPGGDSDAAHACQQGGYQSLVGANGGFTNAGECASYAAQGGTFVTPAQGQFLLPAGETATLSNTLLDSCNAEGYGYQVLGEPVTIVASKPYGCETIPEPDTVIGPYPTAVIFDVVLVDNTCSATFDSSGNHARVTGTNPADVEISDAGFYCEGPEGTPRPPGTTGNLSTTVAVG